VTPRICPRCHSTLRAEDPNSLVFCWNCGAPQVLLSEEFRDQLEQQQLAAQNSASSTPVIPFADPTAVLWPRAMQLAGLAGVVYLGLSLVSQALPPIGLLAVLWMLGAPIVVLGIYSARTPRTRITTGFGVQLGILSGTAIGLASFFANTLILLALRFVLHQPDKFAGPINAAFDQVQKQQLSQPVSPDVLAEMRHLFDLLKIPEFRIGFLLLGSAILFLIYIVYSAIAGAFAGLLRSRAAAR
jgi:hypothetical protein